MIDFGGYEVILEMDEREDNMQAHVRIARFECVPGSDPAQGFHMEVTRTYAGEQPERFESGFFRVDDVWDLPLYLGEEVNERIRAAILEHCFGVIAYAWYQIQTADAEVPFPVLMSIAHTGEEYALCLGSGASVEFRTLEELQAMFPPFGAEHERNYANARAKLLQQFTSRLAAEAGTKPQ